MPRLLLSELLMAVATWRQEGTGPAARARPSHAETRRDALLSEQAHADSGFWDFAVLWLYDRGVSRLVLGGVTALSEVGWTERALVSSGRALDFAPSASPLSAFKNIGGVFGHLGQNLALAFSGAFALGLAAEGSALATLLGDAPTLVAMAQAVAADVLGEGRTGGPAAPRGGLACHAGGASVWAEDAIQQLCADRPAEAWGTPRPDTDWAALADMARANLRPPHLAAGNVTTPGGPWGTPAPSSSWEHVSSVAFFRRWVASLYPVGPRAVNHPQLRATLAPADPTAPLGRPLAAAQPKWAGARAPGMTRAERLSGAGAAPWLATGGPATANAGGLVPSLPLFRRWIAALRPLPPHASPLTGSRVASLPFFTRWAASLRPSSPLTGGRVTSLPFFTRWVASLRSATPGGPAPTCGRVSSLPLFKGLVAALRPVAPGAPAPT
jgi:hypothetical protein